MYIRYMYKLTFTRANWLIHDNITLALLMTHLKIARSIVLNFNPFAT